MTRKLTAEQLYKLIGFHRSPRAAQMAGKNRIRVFRGNDEEYLKWRRQLREEEMAERKRRREENSDSDQQDESSAKQ